MIPPDVCEVPACEAEAIIGVGDEPVRWVCAEHLVEYLELVSRRIEQAVAAATNGGRRS